MVGAGVLAPRFSGAAHLPQTLFIGGYMSRCIEMSLDVFLKSFMKVSSICSSTPLSFDYSKSVVRIYPDQDSSGKVRVDVSFRN